MLQQLRHMEPLALLPPPAACEFDALDHMLQSNDGALGGAADLEELLTLVWGGDAAAGGAEGLREAPPAAHFHSAAAAPEAAVAMRCLDRAHAADCTRHDARRAPPRAPPRRIAILCERARPAGVREEGRGARREARACTCARCVRLAARATTRLAAQRTRLTNSWGCGRFSLRARRCTPPPARADEASFSLHREGGVKALRSLLLLSPEWNSSASREAAARVCESMPGALAAAAHVLRSRAAREMSKGMLLELCRLWRYRSNVWCVRACACARVLRHTVSATPASRDCAAPLPRLTNPGCPRATCTASAPAASETTRR
jgi:hypothetical protein